MGKFSLYLPLPKSKIWLGVALVAASLISCKQKTVESSAVETYDGLARLRPSNLYKIDSIGQFISNFGTQNQDKAWKLYDKFKTLREKDKTEAVWTLKMALTLYPEVSWYADLGDALVEANMFNEAQKAYTVFQKSEIKPNKEQVLNMLKSSILADENFSRYDMAEKAKNLGASTEELFQLMEDSEIQKRLSSNEIDNFKQYLKEGPGGEMDTTAADLPKFLTEFEEISLPFKMKPDDLNKHQYSGEYYDYDPSRDYTRFQYERVNDLQFYPNYDYKYFFRYKNLTAVIYSADTSANATTRINRCLYHRLVLYNTNGEIVSSRIIGVHAGEDVVSYEIKPDGYISLYSFERKWKNPYSKYDITNEVLSTSPLDTTMMFISNEGQITVETEEP